MSAAVTGPGFYAQAQAQGQEVLRAGLLDTAAELLATEGPGALTMRRIAAAAGCSTTVLYRVFGAKDGIADALYREGFARLRARLDAADRAAAGGPAERLAALGRAYRANALAERNLYAVMFAQAVPGFVPDAGARAAAKASLDVLRDAVEACARGGLLRADTDVDAATDAVWAAAHGSVSLELGGHYADEETAATRYRTVTGAAVQAFAPRPGA